MDSAKLRGSSEITRRRLLVLRAAAVAAQATANGKVDAFRCSEPIGHEAMGA